MHRLRARDSESTDAVRRNGLFETSFVPGRALASPTDFDARFAEWLDDANRTTVRTIEARPIDLVEVDRAPTPSLLRRAGPPRVSDMWRGLAHGASRSVHGPRRRG